MGPFDLKEVNVSGEDLLIRPIAWDEEDFVADNESVIATKYELSCPSCGQRVEVLSENIVNGSVTIEECAVGDKSCPIAGPVVVNEDKDLVKLLDESPAPVQTPQIKIHHEGTKSDNKMVEEVIAKKDRTGKHVVDADCPFQDPVEAGELRPA